MGSAYHAEAWHEFYVMMGGSLAALTGLLFVATSIHIDAIAKVPHWQLRAFSNTFALIGLLFQAGLILLPQPVIWLGVELAALNLFLLLFISVRLYLVWRRANAKLPPVRMLAGALSWLVGAFGGVSLITHTGGGLYLNTAACLVATWVCVWNAWSLLVANYQG